MQVNIILLTTSKLLNMRYSEEINTVKAIRLIAPKSRGQNIKAAKNTISK